MKRTLFTALAAAICIFASCNGDITANIEKDDNAQEQKNLAASDAVMRAFQTGDVSILDTVIADDFVDHTERGDLAGRDSLKAMVKYVQSAFKDMKFDKVRDVADGDYVYSWVIYSGTSDGSAGVPEGPYKMSTMEVSRFRDGKAVEHWAFVETRDMMKMMAPQPGMSHRDSSKYK